MKRPRSRLIRCSSQSSFHRRACLESLENRSLLSAVITGDEFRANAVLTNDQINSPWTRHYLDADALGNFVLIWTEWSGANPLRIVGRRFDALGIPLSDEFNISSVSTEASASVAVAPDGRFVVSWYDRNSQGISEIHFQRFYASGTPLGSPVEVNTGGVLPQIGIEDDGDFVIAWDQPSSNSIHARRFTSHGEAAGQDIIVNQGGFASRSSLAIDADGGFVVAWSHKPTLQTLEHDVYTRRFDAQDQPLGDQFLVHQPSVEDQWMTSVAMESDGDFVVAWRHKHEDSELRARRFDASGSPNGNEFRVDDGHSIETGTISVRDDGVFVATYDVEVELAPTPQPARNIYARIFSAANTPGSEFQINSVSRTHQDFPSAKLNEDGGLTVAWFGNGADTLRHDVFVRQFAASDLQPEPDGVQSRLVFYNQSVYDGNDAAANAADDAAIATDKQALLPGQTATFVNYTSYNRGLNGVMIDVLGMMGTPTIGDFTFKVGNTSDAPTWSNGPTPVSISTRLGAGVNGSDRITLIWSDGAIRKQWLEVIFWPNSRNGLQQPDVFYFGNAVGESGNELTNANVSVTDELLARNNATTGTILAPVTNRFDYNRDGRVSVVDQLLARNNITTLQTVVQLISVPTALPLMLDSPAFLDGQAIPLYYTADGQNVSPPLRWLGAPQGTREFALIVDDPDAPTQEPFVHWVIYKIPATLNSLPENINKVLAPAEPAGVLQGRGSSGSVGYRGPSPPAGPVHHYHFKLYALDAELSVSSGLTKLQLLNAMSGHVLATDELIGTYKR